MTPPMAVLYINALRHLTLRITDAAPVASSMKPARYRGVLCIRLVRAKGHRLTLVWMEKLLYWHPCFDPK